MMIKRTPTIFTVLLLALCVAADQPIALPDFKVAVDEVSDSAEKTVVCQRVVVDRQTKEKQIRALIDDRLKTLQQRSGFEHHRFPTHVFVYVHTSRELAENANNTHLAWASLTPVSKDGKPEIDINSKRIAIANAGAQNRFGLTEDQRRSAYFELFLADKAVSKAIERAEAAGKVKKNDPRLDDELRKRARLELAEKYGISVGDLDSIFDEGIEAGWASP